MSQHVSESVRELQAQLERSRGDVGEMSRQLTRVTTERDAALAELRLDVTRLQLERDDAEQRLSRASERIAELERALHPRRS